MKRGHVTGSKKERKARQATIARYKAMGEAIARKFDGKTTAQLLHWGQKA